MKVSDLYFMMSQLPTNGNLIIKHELSEIMTKYGSDKGGGLSNAYITTLARPPNLVCHNYTFFYNILFSEMRNDNIKIFEMGVGVPLCMGSYAGSLLGWKEYFPNSLIFSADFDKDFLYCDDRIKSYYVDQENEESIIQLWNNDELQNNLFDIIIDDGPHTFNSNYLFYINSIHKLKTNGFYIIEDVDLNFIENLYNKINEYNSAKNIQCDIIKFIIPWPDNFNHPHEHILRMNNLIILQLI